MVMIRFNATYTAAVKIFQFQTIDSFQIIHGHHFESSFNTNLAKQFSPERNPALKFACRLCRSSPENTSHISKSKNECVPQLDQIKTNFEQPFVSTELQRASVAYLQNLLFPMHHRLKEQT